MRNCFRDRNFEVSRKSVYSLLKVPGWVQPAVTAVWSEQFSWPLTAEFGPTPSTDNSPQPSLCTSSKTRHVFPTNGASPGTFQPSCNSRSLFHQPFQNYGPFLCSRIFHYILLQKICVHISFQPFVLEAGIATRHISEMNVLFIAICFQYLYFFLS